MYLTIGEKSLLSQDVNGTQEEAYSMTFRTIICLKVEGVTFESVLYQGYYVAPHDRHMIFSSKPNPHKSYFLWISLQSGNI